MRCPMRHTWLSYRWCLYALDGAIGQAAAGVVGNAPYGLCAGFWCGPGAAVPPENLRIYLPLVMRNS
jgi:hypothetical protein